jgi:hypothetical protein
MMCTSKTSGAVHPQLRAQRRFDFLFTSPRNEKQATTPDRRATGAARLRRCARGAQLNPLDARGAISKTERAAHIAVSATWRTAQKLLRILRRLASLMAPREQQT